MGSRNSSGTSISIGLVLFLIFMVLKLCGVITWSWWWVTSPLWMPLAVCGVILAGLFLTALIAVGIGMIFK